MRACRSVTLEAPLTNPLTNPLRERRGSREGLPLPLRLSFHLEVISPCLEVLSPCLEAISPCLEVISPCLEVISPCLEVLDGGAPEFGGAVCERRRAVVRSVSFSLARAPCDRGCLVMEDG